MAKTEARDSGDEIEPGVWFWHPDIGVHVHRTDAQRAATAHAICTLVRVIRAGPPGWRPAAARQAAVT